MKDKIGPYLERYKGELLYVLSNYSTPIVGMVSNFVAAAYIDPADFGAIQSVFLIAPYVAVLHLGTFNGLNRNLSFYKAQSNEAKVQAMVNASKTVANYVSLLGGLIALSVMVYNILNNKNDLIILLATLVLFLKLIVFPQTLHFDTTYRSGQDFKRLGLIKFIENFFTALIGLLPMLIGYIGRIIYDGFKPIIEWYLRFKHQPYSADKKGNWTDIWELMKTGFPLLVGGYILQLFLIADQSFIAVYLGSEALGYYTLSKLILITIPIIPQSLGIILYPKAAALYGLYKNNKFLRTFYWKALIINIAILTPICFLLYNIIELVTINFLPNYLDGIAAAKINVFTCLTFISNGPSIIVGVVKRNLPLILANLIALLLIWIMCVYLSRNTILSIETIAWLRFGVSTTLAIFTLLYSYYLTTLNAYKE